jgi:hypothetical protein
MNWEKCQFSPMVSLSFRGSRLHVPLLNGWRSFEKVALSAPLAINHPDAASVRELQEASDEIQIIVVNELLVRGNLPAATREVRQFLHS